MDTREHEEMKTRAGADVSYLGRTVDQMVWDFMREKDIPGLTLAVVQAPYIPRVVGYGLADEGQKRPASVNTMWPAGLISQAFAAVAAMQLVEDGALDLNSTVGDHIAEAPESWRAVTVLQLLRHAAGLPDYRETEGWSPWREWSFGELAALAAGRPLRFAPGSAVERSATHFLALTEIVERVGGKPYRDFVTARQIDFLGLRRTGFAEDLDGKFHHEDISLSGYTHSLFKQDKFYIDPAAPAVSYVNGKPAERARSSALRGFADIWASAQDLSFWNIGLAGGLLIRRPEHRALLHTAWTLPDGREAPGVAGWQFYKHRGLMDIKGGAPGFSCFLSRFTQPEELVCVTLLANKEGVDFTNLARRIAGAFGDLLSTNYDDHKLWLFEGQFSVKRTVSRLKDGLAARGVPLFAEFDHAANALGAGLELRPTTVLVFGSPQVGTGLMQSDQSIALELPLRMAVWEDEAGGVWLAFPRIAPMAEGYGLAAHPAVPKMQALLETLAREAGSLYK